MATRRKSALEEEKMTDANIAKVIKLLEPSEEGVKPITKKLACELLGMAYNTTRLSGVIEDYKNKKAIEKRRRAEKRGKQASPEEIAYSISEYLAGEPIDSIAKSIYRSPVFVKNILEDNAVPIRNSSTDYFHPQMIPDGAVRERFSLNEVVYSARYDSPARIDRELENHKDHGWIYAIWLLSEKWQQCAYQPASELASLEHLRQIGVRI